MSEHAASLSLWNEAVSQQPCPPKVGQQLKARGLHSVLSSASWIDIWPLCPAICLPACLSTCTREGVRVSPWSAGGGHRSMPGALIKHLTLLLRRGPSTVLSSRLWLAEQRAPEPTTVSPSPGWVDRPCTLALCFASWGVGNLSSESFPSSVCAAPHRNSCY